jgi:hypothetical protein
MVAGTEACTNSSGQTQCPVAGTSLFGYWNATGPVLGLNIANATTSSQYFHYFSPGQYTLVAEDMWGQSAFAYFQVAST